MDRRTATKTLSLSALGFMLPTAFLKSEAKGDIAEKWKPLADNFSAITEVAKGVFFAKGKTTFFETSNLQEIQCNNGWIIFDEFVVVIDSNLPGNANILLNEVRSRTSKPVRYVLNTHHHGDHIYGNTFWVEQGASIISCTGLVEALKKFETGYYENIPGRWEKMQPQLPGLENFPLHPPTLTFDKKLIVEDKNRTVELIHLGVGHTTGDSIAWLPKERIMFVGDACLNGPYNLFRDAQIQPWIETLEKMKSYKPLMVIPGHGNIGNEDTIDRQQTYFKSILDWVKKEKASRNEWEIVRSRIPLLRKEIESNERTKRYLIAEPAVVQGFSLESHIKVAF